MWIDSIWDMVLLHRDIGIAEVLMTDEEKVYVCLECGHNHSDHIWVINEDLYRCIGSGMCQCKKSPVGVLMLTLDAHIKTLADTSEKFLKLKGFVKEIMGDFPELSNWDGFELQDLAEKHRILIPEIRHAPCGEECTCAEVYNGHGFEKGAQCFRLVEFL